MFQVECCYDCLFVWFFLIISCLFVGEMLNMCKLVVEFGVLECILYCDFCECLIYFDFEYQDGCCCLLIGGCQEIWEEVVMQFVCQLGIGVLFFDMDYYLVNLLLSSKDFLLCFIWYLGVFVMFFCSGIFI